MAKRRMITQDINIDEDLNTLSIEAQLLFIKILSVSDDCGVVPANEYTLKSLTNPPDKIRGKFNHYLEEICLSGLLIKFDYNGKPYLCFKKNSFERQQAYLIKNRTKSEYLKITVEEFFAIYNAFLPLPEISGNNSNFPQVSSLTHKEIKDKSNKIKDNRDDVDFKNIPPTLEDIKSICEKRQYPNIDVEAEKFYNHYTSNGWKVGKNKMVNWGASLANWFKNYKEWGNNGTHTPNRANTGGLPPQVDKQYKTAKL